MPQPVRLMHEVLRSQQNIDDVKNFFKLHFKNTKMLPHQHACAYRINVNTKSNDPEEFLFVYMTTGAGTEEEHGKACRPRFETVKSDYLQKKQKKGSELLLKENYRSKIVTFLKQKKNWGTDNSQTNNQPMSADKYTEIQPSKNTNKSVADYISLLFNPTGKERDTGFDTWNKTTRAATAFGTSLLVFGGVGTAAGYGVSALGLSVAAAATLSQCLILGATIGGGVAALLVLCLILHDLYTDFQADKAAAPSFGNDDAE